MRREKIAYYARNNGREGRRGEAKPAKRGEDLLFGG
jgi:hypothetical protein